MQRSIFWFLLILIAIADGYAAEQPKNRAKGSSTNAGNVREAKEELGVVQRSRESIVKGATIDLRSMEVRALEAEKTDNWEAASLYYREGSRAARLSGQYQKAIAYGNKSYDMGEKAQNSLLKARAIIILVFAYRRVGQNVKTREILEKGVEIVKQIPAGGPKRAIEAQMSRQLGDEYLRGGESQRAIEHLSHSVQLQESELSTLRSARFQRAPQLIQITQYSMVQVLNRLGNAYREAGNIESAASSFGRALAIIKDAGLKTHLEGNTYHQLGQLYLGRKDFGHALENLQKAADVADKFQHALLIQGANSLIGDLYLQTQKPTEAIPYYKKALESIESSRSLLESEDLRTSFVEDKAGTYSGIIQANIEAMNFDDAFNYSERARSRAFLDVLGSKVQLARSGTLLEHERALQARIGVLRAMMGAQEADSSEAVDLRRDLADAEREYNEYLTKVRKENKEQASLMNVEPLTIKQVQELIDPGTTIMEYFVANNNVWLWVVEKDRVQFLRASIARKDLVAKVTELRDTIYQFGEKDRFNALSQELHKLLIQPALPHIRGKELIVIPHDVLHYLPFQALLAANGRYLIEQYPIYYLSSASLLQFTQEKRKAKGELSSVLAQGGNLLAFGNPDLNDSKMALQFAEIEAGEIKKLYSESTVLLRKEATEGKAKSLSPQNDVVHFASHAELSEDDPLASAILLAKSDKEDGRLEVREIFGMDLKASLVVLSACETGLGKLSSGDELVGLTRAFIYAGTPSVVASLWNVEDSSTAQLMASFYKNLKTMTKVEALRQAQLQLIQGKTNSELLARRGIGGVGKLGEASHTKSDSSISPVSTSISTSHPYFWAPFILVGEGK